MASSSSSVMASSNDDACNYDVFLSFRGEDTRYSFIDHLYHKLIQAGICSFRDEEEINRGEELKPEIERAIKASRASIVVLSENYATSTWCLDELLLILQQRRECGHIVLPIFYHVKPTDVRNHKNKFAIQVNSCSSRWTHNNVNMWKTALMQVADLTGFELSGPETNFLKEIVDTIYDRLDQKEVHLPLNMTGMATRYNEINFWLDKSNLEVLVIYGMGGSGKTTLAKYIYDLVRKSFEYVSFVEDIGSRCENPNGLLEVQEQLLKDILGGKKRKIPGVSRGTRMIEDALQKKRSLIVLDDIIGSSQLVALLGSGDINSQSKVIVTTRENADNWFHFPYWRFQKYKMKLLNDGESSELLSRHAFGSKIPMAGFEELVLQTVEYCEGNPLALEVLGSSLSKDNTILNWKSRLNLLEKDIDYRIQDVLLRSYMSLPYNSEKDLFLHIACFFIGKDIDYVVNILEPDYSAISGIKILIDRCLLSVSPNKKLIMHSLLQEMGKHIVRQESIKFPENRSRVWLSRDSYKILKKGMGSKTVEGLALDMEILRKEDFAFKSSKFKTNAIQSMDGLKLLQLNFVELSGSYEYVSEDLRWLCWLGFHLTSIPSDLYMGNLVAIDMSYSNLEVLEPPVDMHSLKILNLIDSHKLTKISKIFRIPNLETLILWNCYSLINVCKTIEGLKSLSLLNMTGCKNVFKRIDLSAASAFSFSFSLHRLFLNGCHLECTDSFSLSFTNQPLLQYLNLGNSQFEFLPSYDHLKNLRVLDLSFCSKLKCLLCLPSTHVELYVYYCESLEKITFQSHRFTLQEFGYEGCIHLYEVEGFIKLVPIAKILSKGKGSQKVEGLSLDMEMLWRQGFVFKSSRLETTTLQSMDSLKLLQVNFAKLIGSYEYVSEDLRWLCWFGFHLTSIPFDLYMGNLVAIDMSYSNLEVFEPPMDIRSLKILNLKDSYKLTRISKISRIPNLETLILWNCYSLINVCKTIEGLKSLTLLNMTDCKNIFRRIDQSVASAFSFSFSLHRLYLNGCHLECSDPLPLSFTDQPLLQYLNLGNSQIEFLPSYDHLKNLRVLDLSFCIRLQCLLCLPNTLAELYVYNCESLEKITFQSHRFTLQEFGYEGCVHLYEVEGYIKLVPIAKLDETDLGHMKWLKEYQNHEVCLAGDDEPTTGRNRNIQMLYEFDIMSTSLPDIKDPLMTPMYISMLPSLSFDVPACPNNKRLKGINVTFKYSMPGDDCAWFCKISTTNGDVDWMYHPRVFGKPNVGEVCIWLSYWPIGNTLDTGDTVNVSIIVISRLEVHECGVSLVYSDQEALENKTGWEEILGGDLSGFQLSTGAYYLCRHNFFELMEVGRLTPNWFRILVGDANDYTEVRGWRKTGRPKHVNSSFTELKTVRCIIQGPQLEDIYNIAEMYKSSIGDKTMSSTSSFFEGKMKSATKPKLPDEKMEEQIDSEGMSKAFGSDEIESDSPPHEERLKSVVKIEPGGGQEIQKVVLAVNLSSQTKRHKMIKELSELQGIKSVDYDTKEGKLTVIGVVDPETLIVLRGRLQTLNY